MSSVNIALPGPLQALTRETSGNVAVEHAKLDCRMAEVVAALALRDFLDGRVVAIFAPKVARVKYLLSTWLSDAEEKVRRYSTVEGDATYHCMSKGTAAIWICGGHKFPVEDLPFHTARRVYSLETQDILTDLRPLIDAPTYFTGVMADRDHWFYNYCRKGDHPSSSFSVGVSGRNGTVRPPATI